MLEAKYYKDHRHNYMILRCEREEMTNSYQHKILTSDKIGEILRCSVRHINGATYYYYDISSRTTLEGLYRGRQMSYAQVKDILYQICGICERLSGYFMEETKLVLQPEHIYYDITNNKYIGLYYPDYQAEGADAYRPLMDFLLEHINTEDVQLTESIYQLYEMAEEKHFCIEDALRLLENREEPVREAVQEEAQLPAWEAEQEQIIDRSGMYEVAEELREEKPHCSESHKGSLFYVVFMVLSMLGIAGALAVGYMYELAQEEQITLYGAIAAMGVCLLICLMGIISGSRKKLGEKAEPGRKASRDTARESQGRTDREFYADEEMIPLEQVISRDMNLEIAENKPTAYHQSERYGNTASYDMRSDIIQGTEDCGNTVFFDESSIEEYKLYAVDKKNKRHIELKQFPCTVGKMAGCVDYVLSDDSVSRIHAQFDKQGDKVLMTDMNSTNGTYKNGLRMQPRETVEIEPGDEIRFGNLNYCYR